MKRYFLNCLPYFLLMISAFLLFSWIYGTNLLNLHHFSWLLYDDSSSSFFGFNYFYSEPWLDPPGRIAGLNSPMGTSLVYSDSFPFISLVLKILKSLNFSISEPFQFVGIWILFCIIMQGVASYWILKRETNDFVFSIQGSGFFLLSPVFFYRSLEPTRHFSLMAHFLVIIAIGEWLLWFRQKNYRFWVWYILFLFSFGLHFYFFVIILLVYGLILFEIWFQQTGKRKGLILQNLILSISLLFIGYACGYFSIPVSDTKGGGFGLFAMDLFTWILSDGHSRVLPFDILNGLGPREGFQYLGLGVLLGLFFSIRNLKRHPLNWLEWIKNNRNLVFFVLFILTLALSRRLWIFGNRMSIFFTIPLWYTLYYNFFRKIFSLNRSKSHFIAFLFIVLLNFFGSFVRSSGRMGWLLNYSILFLFLFMAGKLKKKKRAIVFVLFMIQFYDLYPLLNHVRSRYEDSRTFHASYQISSALQSFLNRPVNRIIFITNEFFQDSELNFYALLNHIPIGPTYLARHDHPARFQWIEKWRENLIEKNIQDGDIVLIEKSEENLALLSTLKSLNIYDFFEKPSSILVALRSQ